MNKFDDSHLAFFNAQFGAASDISSGDETKKGQITCTGDEVQILIEHFGKENIWRGKASDNEEVSEKKFLLENTGEIIKLPLVFPKPKKEELRLYMRKGEGFKPDDKCVWFVFTSTANPELLSIGYRTKEDWEQIKNSRGIDDLDIEDDEEEEYQRLLRFKLARQKVSATSGRYPRNATVAENAIRKSKYRCEVDESHKTFLSASSGKQFVEAHHLIPMMKQSDFACSLDLESNVFALCPNCHRAIHHGSSDVKQSIIEKLYREREGQLRKDFPDISLEYLLECYGL